MNILKITKTLPKISSSTVLYDDELSLRELARDIESMNCKLEIFEIINERIANYHPVMSHAMIELLPGEIEHMFGQYLIQVLESNKSPWAIALEFQDKYWDLLKGNVINILRLKLGIIGYDPKVWLEAGK